jgi:hypothetical protein
MTVWATPKLDGSALDAVAILALYLTGEPADAQQATALLDELTKDPDGVVRMIGGLASVCATLLALHEFDTGDPPAQQLRRAALAVSQAQLA